MCTKWIIIIRIEHRQKIRVEIFCSLSLFYKINRVNVELSSLVSAWLLFINYEIWPCTTWCTDLVPSVRVIYSKVLNKIKNVRLQSVPCHVQHTYNLQLFLNLYIFLAHLGLGWTIYYKKIREIMFSLKAKCKLLVSWRSGIPDDLDF